MKTLILIILTTLSSSTVFPADGAVAADEFRLGTLFLDHMVLQRDTAVPVWGWAKPGATVSVTFSGQKKSSVADKSGRWAVELEPLKASAKERTLQCAIVGGEAITLSNVLVGEVWICSGQSNMAWPLKSLGKHYQKEVDAARDPQLRLCKVKELYAALPLERTEARWVESTPEEALEFSAVALFFGRKLRKELKIPVGLVQSARGGSPVECWMSAEALRRGFPEFSPKLDTFADIVAKTGGVWELRKQSKEYGIIQRTPTVFYNAHIHPLIPFGMRGVIWYQGESNVGRADQYSKLFPAIHWESQLEHAYMILEYRRFNGADISAYIPFIENAVVFFDAHYRKREAMRSGKELDTDGHLHIYPAKACETYRGATNPADVISGLHACVDEILLLDDDALKLRSKAWYQAFKKTIPPYTYTDNKEDYATPGARVIMPAKSWKTRGNGEIPMLYPLFPFNRFALGKDDMQVFRDTYKHGKFRKGNLISWHQDGIFFARMGQTAEAVDFNSRKLDDSERRFPTFWGPGHDWLPDHNWGGSGMIGLQEMLMQTIGNEIRLFPAWPKEWDVDFKLHAPHNTTVEVSLRHGEITKLEVSPASRRSDIVLPKELDSLERSGQTPN